MSDHGDEEDRRLLDESSSPVEPPYDTEAKGQPERSTTPSIWVSLGFVVVAVLLTLPFLGYLRHIRSPDTVAPVKQLAIPLYPEKHVSRGATTLELHWNVTLGTMAPDGVEKQVYLVNGMLAAKSKTPMHYATIAHFDQQAHSQGRPLRLAPETESSSTYTTTSQTRGWHSIGTVCD
jgi:hypothetical protein